MANVKTQTTTKQKVVTAVAIVAVAAAAFGILSAVGRSKGYGFGYPFIFKTIPKKQIRTYPPLKQKEIPELPANVKPGPADLELREGIDLK